MNLDKLIFNCLQFFIVTTCLFATTISCIDQINKNCPFQDSLCFWKEDLNTNGCLQKFNESLYPYDFGEKVKFQKKDKYLQVNCFSKPCHLFIELSDQETPLQCMTFEYYSASTSKNSFSVQLLDSKSNKEVAWRKPILSIEKWTKQHVQLNLGNKVYTKLMFVFETSGILLSEVLFEEGSCFQPRKCTFDDGEMCDWKQSVLASEFKFELVKAGQSTNSNYPLIDARHNNHSGHYLLLHNELKKFEKGEIRLYSSGIHTLKKQDLPFAFRVRFRLWRSNENTPQIEIWFINRLNKGPYLLSKISDVPYTQNIEWELYESNEFKWEEGQIMIKFTYTNLESVGILALDDLEIVLSYYSNSLVCEFKHNYCGYYESNNDVIPFSIGIGAETEKFNLFQKLDKNIFDFKPIMYAYFDNKYLESDYFGLTGQWIFPSFKEPFLISSNISFFIHSEEKDQNANQIFIKVIFESKNEYYDIFEYEANNSNGWQIASFKLIQQAVYRIHIKVNRINGKGSSIVGLSNLFFDFKPLKLKNSKLNELSCDFTIDLCGWRQTNLNNPLVLKQHKFDNDHNYILLNYNKTSKAQIQQFVIQSPLYSFSSTNVLQQYCLTFEYSIKGSNNQLLFTLGDGKILFNETANVFGKHWIHRYTTISVKKSFRFVIQALLQEGQIHIGGVHVQNNVCQSQYLNINLDFEQSIKMGEILISPYSTRITEAKELNQLDKNNYSYFADHTYQSPNGKCLAFIFNNITNHVSNSLMLTFPITRSTEDKICVQFWLASSVNAPVNVSIDYDYETVWSLENNFPDLNWYPFQAQTYNYEETYSFEIIIKWNANQSINGFIAFDDLIAKNGECQSNLIDCDFEDECLWENLYTSTNKITINHFTQELVNKFERIVAADVYEQDHTRESSSGFILTLSKKGFGVYKSPKIFVSRQTIKTMCFQFWYKLTKNYYSNSKIRLLISQDNSSDIKIVSQFMINQTTKWTVKQVNIRLTNYIDNLESYDTKRSFVLYIAFENFNEELYLDDLQLMNDECPNEYDPTRDTFHCEDVREKYKEIPFFKKCDGEFDCKDKSDEKNCGECNFEMFNTCRYQLISNSSANTKWNIFKTLIANENKVIDQNDTIYDVNPLTKNSYFLLGNLSTADQNICIQAVSPIIRHAYQNCQFKFSGIIDGIKLKVKLKKENSILNLNNSLNTNSESEINKLDPLNWTELDLWQSQNNQETLDNVTLFLGELITPIRIEFEACRIFNGKGIVQLMNFEKIDCFQKSNRPRFEDCNGRFDCQNKECVDFEMVCDGRNDCSNGLDEKKCDFDYFGTDFDQKLSAIRIFGFNHTLANKQTEISNIQTDHSNKMAIGRFIWTSSSFFNTIDRASFLSGFIIHNRIGCEMRLFYILKGNHSLIQVFTKDWIDLENINAFYAQILTTSSEKNVTQWNQLKIPLYSKRLKNLFRIRIEFRLLGKDQALLIDDLSFTKHCYPLSETDVKSFNQIDALLNNNVSDWTIKHKDPVLDMFFDKKITLQASETFLFSNIIQMCHIFKANESWIQNYSSKTNQIKELLPFDLKSNRCYYNSDRCIDNLSSLPYETIVIKSPTFQRFSIKSDYIILEYIFSGYGWNWIQLVEDQTGQILYEQVKYNEHYSKYVYIPVKNLFSSLLQFTLKAQFEAFNTNLALIQFEFTNYSKQEFCSFDGTSECKFIKKQQPTSNFVLKKFNYIKHPDFTLGSDHGSFMIAGCGISKSKIFFLMLSNLLHERNFNVDMLLEFKFTTFYKNSNKYIQHHTKRNHTGDLKIVAITRNTQILFNLRINLNGEWNTARLLISRKLFDQISFVASFDEPNSDYCIGIDNLLVLPPERFLKKQTIACDNKYDCSWFNDNNINNVNWRFTPYLLAKFNRHNSKQKAIITSPWHVVSSGGQCIQFQTFASKNTTFIFELFVINEFYSTKLVSQIVNDTLILIKTQLPEISQNKAQKISVSVSPLNSIIENNSATLTIKSINLPAFACGPSQLINLNFQLNDEKNVQKKHLIRSLSHDLLGIQYYLIFLIILIGTIYRKEIKIFITSRF